MKKILLGIWVVLILGLFGCAHIKSFCNKTDDVVEKGKVEYVKFVEKADMVIAYKDMVDSTVYKPIKAIYYSGDTFTPAFNNLSDTDQNNLVKADAFYLKMKKEIERVEVDYKSIKEKAEKGYYDYYKIRNKTLKITGMVEDLPKMIVNLKGFMK